MSESDLFKYERVMSLCPGRDELLKKMLIQWEDKNGYLSTKSPVWVAMIQIADLQGKV